jgi:nucleotide-binding universal stress UspA family protein
MIPQVNKILFTSDLSSNTRPAFDYAAAIACRQGAGITILHVMEEQTPYASVHVQGFLGEDRWQQLRKSHENEARQLLSGKIRQGAIIKEALGEFCRIAKAELGEAGLTTDEVLVKRGNVVDEILNTAAETKCDLIVMAHYVRGKASEAILGSTSRRVLRRSPIPVLLVPVQVEQD